MAKFGFDKEARKRRDDIQEAINTAFNEMEDAVAGYLAAIEPLVAEVNAKVVAYNEALERARGFLEDEASSAQEAFDEKSERWQEGDKGQAVGEWIAELTGEQESIEDVVETVVDGPDFPTDAYDLSEHVQEEPSL